MKQPKIPLKKRIVRNLTVTLFYIVRFLLRLLPLGLSISIGGLIGRLCFHVLPKEKKTALNNLAASFPEKDEKEIYSIARESLICIVNSLIDIINIDKFRKRFYDYIKIDGEEYLKKATGGKGCMYLTGHVGNWELMGFYLAHIGIDLNPIAREVYDKRLNDIIIDVRKENGVNTILRGKPDTSRKMIKALKNKGVLAMLIDQDIKVQGIFVDFFNQKAYTTKGAASIALKFKCEVFAGFIHREGKVHKITIRPLDLIDTGDKERDIYDNTLMYTKAVEDAIRKHPAQWVWMHKRWKTKQGKW